MSDPRDIPDIGAINPAIFVLLKLVESGELEPTAARIAVDAVRRNFGPDYPQPSHKL